MRAAVGASDGSITVVDMTGKKMAKVRTNMFSRIKIVDTEINALSNIS